MDGRVVAEEERELLAVGEPRGVEERQRVRLRRRRVEACAKRMPRSKCFKCVFMF